MTKRILKEDTEEQYTFVEDDLEYLFPGAGITQPIEFSAYVELSDDDPEVGYHGGARVGDIWWNDEAYTPSQNMLIKQYLDSNKEKISDRLQQQAYDTAEDRQADRDYQYDMYHERMADDRRMGIGESSRRFVLTGRQINLLREAYGQEYGGTIDEMAAKPASEASKKIQPYIDKLYEWQMQTGRVSSVWYVKGDGSLRKANVRVTPEQERSYLERKAQERRDAALAASGGESTGTTRAKSPNVFTYWDHNRIRPTDSGQPMAQDMAQPPSRGDWRNASLGGILTIKMGDQMFDLTQVNSGALGRLAPEKQQEVMRYLQMMRDNGVKVETVRV